MRCCVIIPTYREFATLPLLLPLVFAQQEALAPVELFVLIVDDTPPEEGAAPLAALRERFPHLRTLQGEKLGLGMAYQRGFAYALDTLHADLLVQMDGDLQHDPAVLPALVQACRPPVGVVVGSRFTPGGEIPGLSLSRQRMSRVGTTLIRLLGGLPPLDDYTSGYRCWQASSLRTSLEHCRGRRAATRGYAFQSSLLAELLLSGGQAREIPIVFGERRHGASKLARRDLVEFLMNLVHLRRRRRVHRRNRRLAARAASDA